MDLIKERGLFEKGFQNVCGVDEAGRGALAGPIVSGAVILQLADDELLEKLNDSKQLTAEKRELLFPEIIAKARSWAIGVSANTEIDRHGISFSNKVSMIRAVNFLSVKADYVLSDHVAKMQFDQPFELIAKGDATVASIAAASILAKVFRDRMMDAFAKKYPEYAFEVHKGYGTAEHMAKINVHGACEIHRHSYQPLWPKLF